MPFLHKLEQSNQELQSANQQRLDAKSMKQLLDKVTRERLETLKDAKSQLSKPQFARLKRLLKPVAEGVEKVGELSKRSPCS